MAKKARFVQVETWETVIRGGESFYQTYHVGARSAAEAEELSLELAKKDAKRGRLYCSSAILKFYVYILAQ